MNNEYSLIEFSYSIIETPEFDPIEPIEVLEVININ
jgi:hypothetical protein